MADLLPDPFPAEDETPDVLLTDATDHLVAQDTDYEPQPADLITAILAAEADEDAIAYALLREKADDWLRDFGREVLAVPDPQPVPAATTTTWTARPGMSGTLEPGDDLVLAGINGPVAFEVLEETEVGVGATVAGVAVQAMTAGAAANGATNPVQLDIAPAWVQSVTVDAPATAGADAAGDEEFMAQVVRAALLQYGAVVDVRDAEIAIQDVDGIDRALVRNHFDVDTSNPSRPGYLGIWPLDEEGEPVVDPVILERADLRVNGPNRMLQGFLKFGVASYTTIAVTAVVGVRNGFDPVLVDAEAEEAARQVLDPAEFGQPDLGQTRLWRLRLLVRRSEIAAAIAKLDSVDFVTKVVLTVTAGPGSVIAAADPDDEFEVGDVLLAGDGPLPRPGAITITTVAA